MSDYAELIKLLRDCAEINSLSLYKRWLMKQAADAIEELQGKIDEFYFLAQDVNRKEIAEHISENTLDAWIYAFQRYAAKIAQKPLPEPPKEEATDAPQD